MQNVNCQCFKGGKCTHQAAPRALFGVACILWNQSDLRIAECALQAPYPKPALATVSAHRPISGPGVAVPKSGRAPGAI